MKKAGGDFGVIHCQPINARLSPSMTSITLSRESLATRHRTTTLPLQSFFCRPQNDHVEGCQIETPQRSLSPHLPFNYFRLPG